MKRLDPPNFVRYDTGAMRSWKRVSIAGAPLLFVIAGALVLVAAEVVSPPTSKPGYREPKLEASFHRVAVGDTMAQVRSLMGSPAAASRPGYQVVARAIGRPTAKPAFFGSHVRLKFIRSVPVQTWYFGGVYEQGSYELDFANGKLAAKYRY
jgi:hypothetical protein